VISEKNKRAFYEKNGVLVGYLLAGYPEKDDFLDIVRKCSSSQLDILEIGIPSKKPYADGDVICKAHKATDKGLVEDIGFFIEIRRLTQKPIWLMAYYEEFIQSKKYQVYAQAGVADALVIPDIPFDQRCLLREEMKEFNIDVLGFTNPEMTDSQLKTCFENFPIVYEQLYSGRTGENECTGDYMHMLEMSKQYKELAKVAGFGISTTQKAKKLLDEGFCGVIIGTEIISRLNISAENMIQFINEVGNGIRS